MSAYTRDLRACFLWAVPPGCVLDLERTRHLNLSQDRKRTAPEACGVRCFDSAHPAAAPHTGKWGRSGEGVTQMGQGGSA